ncbi:DUF2510 domain-containing protein [Paenarthrobacter sp. NPDC089322]|uniref:DUF2510 domain-containing protein n=1 Tax=Paenarthrobacter sp. NPDC089322 TaxID=3155065 RepID=UPI00343A2857
MTQAAHGSATPAGWYPDPMDPRQLRWWDGVQWTAHLTPVNVQFQALYKTPRVLVSAETPVYNPFIWAIVLLPLVSLLLLFTWQPEFRTMTTRQGVTTIDPFSIYTPTYFALQISGFVIYALSVWFAFLDRQRLVRSGVVRPFHWAWTFLSPVVYIIGRSVIVRKVAPNRGLWPVWATIGMTIISLVVASIWMSSMMQALYSQFGYSVNA